MIEENVFYWSTGFPVKVFTDWARGQPGSINQGRCVEMRNGNLKWHRNNCALNSWNQKQAYVALKGEVII